MKRSLLVAGLVVLISVVSFLTRSKVRTHPTRREVNFQSFSGAPASPSKSNFLLTSPLLASSSQFDPGINPYAGSLREAGKSKRPWDVDFLPGLPSPNSGAAIRFELTRGLMAVGALRVADFRDGELIFVSGVLSEPEAEKFFFL